jgi:hypothetical protein
MRHLAGVQYVYFVVTCHLAVVEQNEKLARDVLVIATRCEKQMHGWRSIADSALGVAELAHLVGPSQFPIFTAEVCLRLRELCSCCAPY